MFKKNMRMAAGIVMALAIVCTSVSVCPDVSSAAVKAKKITLEKNKITIAPFEKATIKVKSVTPGNANKAVTFKSGNKKIVSVNKKGVITSKGVLGSADITVTSKSNKKVKKVVKVNVKLTSDYTKKNVMAKEIKTLLQGEDVKILKKILSEQQGYGANVDADVFSNIRRYFKDPIRKKDKDKYLDVLDLDDKYQGGSFSIIKLYTFKKINGEYRLVRIELLNKNLQGNLNLTELPELEDIILTNNQLTGVDVSGLTKLKSLTISDNPLTSLNISGCTSLPEYLFNHQFNPEVNVIR